MIIEKFAEELPHIRRGPQDQVVIEFDTTIILKCETTKPVKAVKWLKNKKEIWARKGKYSMNVEETIAKLTIMHFDLNDCAEYIAVLREDEESAPAKVELKIPPTIKLSKSLPNNVLKLNCGTDSDIEFDYKGFPEVDIKTTINDKPLSKMRYHTHTYNNKLSLRLKNVIQEDSGILKVMVENEIGSASEEVQLVVISVPSKPLHLTAFNITSRSVMLKWEKAEDNRSPIINYIIERRAADSKRWRNVGNCDPEQCEFLIEDLYSSESYAFRVIAVNEVGKGAPSNVVDVVTINESTELKEETEFLSPPNYLKGTLIEDSKIALITWEKVEEADEYIIEKVKLKNDWEQIGITRESKFEDSFNGSSTNKYRVIAKKGNYLSTPSEETEIIIVPDRKKKEVEQIEMKQSEKQKFEKSDDQVKQEKVSKKVEQRKEDKKEEKVEVIGKFEDKPEQKEVKAKGKAETEMMRKEKSEKKQEEIEVGRKIEDEFKSSEKLVEEVEKKVVKKKTEKKKKTAKKDEVPEDEAEITNGFPEGEVEDKQKSKMELEREKKKYKIKLDSGRIESIEKVEDEKVEGEEALEERHLEKKLKRKSEKKLEVEQKLKPVKELEKDSEKKESAEVKQEDGKLAMKKKIKKEFELKETLEQKLEESLPNESVTQKKKKVKKEVVVRAEKLEVKFVNDSITVDYGTKSFELSANISGNFDECFWTKDEKAINKKMVKTTVNTSVLRLENVDELTAGLYHCTATNKTEKSTARIRVIVTGYPFFGHESNRNIMEL